MNVLVLGSSGQIGNPLVGYLEKSGHKVTRWDIQDGIHHDLRQDRTRFNTVLEKTDFVVFLAFDVGGSKYLKEYQNSFIFLDNNIRIMMNVFNSLHEYHKPFIFITSQMSNMPGAYGQLKAIGEYYTRSLNGLIVKLWNVYGPEDHCTEDKRHAITDFILAAAKDLKIKMLSDGREERQFLYVDDCCEALATLMNNYKNLDRSKIYDISTGEWVTIHETAQVVSELFGGIPVIQGKAGNNIQAGFRNEPNDNIKPYWTPKISLREGIKRVVDRYNKVGLI